ncbi:tetratricopeptide repeat protein [Amycolatopsis minnesotensis]|uniref:Tetratricopeptide repeat protein n=1 Tax=Amycolatopsis minnesotensis TaxID=337894 RepID=A0ABP5B8T2_9PSEU
MSRAPSADVAAELVAEHYRGEDYRDTRLDVLCEILNLSKGALNNRFDGKRPLLIMAALFAWRQWPGRSPGTCTSISRARTVMHDGIRSVAEFLNHERALMTQLVIGLGDLSNYEKRGGETGWNSENLGDPWAPVLREARLRARWTGFAGLLGSHTAAAGRAVGQLDAADHESTGAALSDLVLRTWWQNTQASPTTIADQLVGLWFDGCFAAKLGSWVGRADVAEIQARRSLRPEHAPTWRVASQAELGTALMSGQTLWRRAMKELDTALAEHRRMDPVLRGQLSPLLMASLYSRVGQSAFQFGDFVRAEASLEQALTAAEATGNDQDLARACTNLADLYLRTDRVAKAVELARQAVASRPLRPPFSSPVPRLWDNAVISSAVLVRCELEAGRVIDAVNRARDLVAVVTGHDGRTVAPSGPAAAAAWSCQGRALLAAGHSAAALESLDKAATVADTAAGVNSLPARQARVLRARCLLMRGDVGDARLLLEALAENEEWIAENMSFRHALAVRRWLGLTQLAGGYPDAGAETLTVGFAQLAEHHLPTSDRLVVDYRRALAQAAVAQGRPGTAVADLAQLVDEQLSAPPLPRRLRLLADLGEAYVADGDPDRALRVFRQALATTKTSGVDGSHPAILAIAVALAELSGADSDLEALRHLVRPALLRHGLRTLEEGHPLVRRADGLLAPAGKAGRGQKQLPQ